MPQDSIRDLFFLICINDSNLPIKYFVVLVNNFKRSLKSLDKQINADLKKLANWLKANETLLNIGKTELALWILPKNQVEHDLKIKLNGKWLYETNSIIKNLDLEATNQLCGYKTK